MLLAARLPAREPGECDRYRLELASDIALVGHVVESMCECCFQDGAATSRTRFRLCTVLAEAVANAMLYGNGGDPSRRVTVEVELCRERLIVAVTDEGDGFNHQCVPYPRYGDAVEATRGRGLFVIHHLADHVAFNERGNTIWMTLPRR